LTGTAGLNVLLHGDGGQFFFDFPNQAVQNNLMGVVVPAPNKNLFWGGGSGLQRTDGVAHAAAVNSLIQTQLPKDVALILEMFSSLGIWRITPSVWILRSSFRSAIQDGRGTQL
jgi:hypothetical protein